MKAKKIVALVSALILLAAGVWMAIDADTLTKTYDKDVDVTTLYTEAVTDAEYKENTSKAMSEANQTMQFDDDYNMNLNFDIADDIVARNLNETKAANNVAAVVFDFRGFDTLGESFILLTAIAGSFVILSKSHKKKKEDEE